MLGERYEQGVGVEPDIKQAVQWYETAAFVPPTTQFVYMPGFGKTPGSMLPVSSSFSGPGDPIALAHVGQLYVSGHGVAIDEARGREMLACAASLGIADGGGVDGKIQQASAGKPGGS